MSRLVNFWIVGQIVGCVMAAGCSKEAADPSKVVPEENSNSNIDQSALREAIAQSVRGLSDEARSRHDEALNAEPFANQKELLVGKWHGSKKPPGFEA